MWLLVLLFLKVAVVFHELLLRENVCFLNENSVTPMHCQLLLLQILFVLNKQDLASVIIVEAFCFLHGRVFNFLFESLIF